MSEKDLVFDQLNDEVVNWLRTEIPDNETDLRERMLLSQLISAVLNMQATQKKLDADCAAAVDLLNEQATRLSNLDQMAGITMDSINKLTKAAQEAHRHIMALRQARNQDIEIMSGNWHRKHAELEGHIQAIIDKEKVENQKKCSDYGTLEKRLQLLEGATTTRRTAANRRSGRSHKKVVQVAARKKQGLKTKKRLKNKRGRG